MPDYYGIANIHKVILRYNDHNSLAAKPYVARSVNIKCPKPKLVYVVTIKCWD